MAVLLAPPSTLAFSLSAPPINPGEAAILPIASQRELLPTYQLQKSILTAPAHSMDEQNMWEESAPEVISTDKAFTGYNLFTMVRRNMRNTTINNHSLFITDMEGELIRGIEELSFTQGNWSLHNAKFINSTTMLLGLKDWGAVLWDIYDNTIVPLYFWGHHDF